MNALHRIPALIGVAALLMAPALGQQPAQGGPTASAPTSTMPGTADGHHDAPGAPGPADQAMMDGMKNMSQGMATAPMTGDPDRDFVAMMVPHHQGAIDMARAELQYGKDPALRRLAKDIVAAQEKEIGTMKQWQAGSRKGQ